MPGDVLVSPCNDGGLVPHASSSSVSKGNVRFVGPLKTVAAATESCHMPGDTNEMGPPTAVFGT